MTATQGGGAHAAAIGREAVSCGHRTMSEHDGTQKIGQILDGLLGRRGLGRSHREAEAVRRAWAAAAGSDFGGHTRVRHLRKGVLTVDVDSAPLCHRLAGFERDRLLVAVQQEAKSAWISELRFRLGAFDREEGADS